MKKELASFLMTVTFHLLLHAELDIMMKNAGHKMSTFLFHIFYAMKSCILFNLYLIIGLLFRFIGISILRPNVYSS